MVGYYSPWFMVRTGHFDLLPQTPCRSPFRRSKNQCCPQKLFNFPKDNVHKKPIHRFWPKILFCVLFFDSNFTLKKNSPKICFYPKKYKKNSPQNTIRDTPYSALQNTPVSPAQGRTLHRSEKVVVINSKNLKMGLFCTDFKTAAYQLDITCCFTAVDSFSDFVAIFRDFRPFLTKSRRIFDEICALGPENGHSGGLFWPFSRILKVYAAYPK